MSGKCLDYFALFNTVSLYGGYDVVNGVKGGWAAVFRDVPSVQSADVPSKEASSSYRVKKVGRAQVHGARSWHRSMVRPDLSTDVREGPPGVRATAGPWLGLLVSA
jgi:hypothetical protein